MTRNFSHVDFYLQICQALPHVRQHRHDAAGTSPARLGEITEPAAITAISKDMAVGDERGMSFPYLSISLIMFILRRWIIKNEKETRHDAGE